MSKREGSRRTRCFKMMIFMWTLAFPRETSGATFFRQYDKNGNHTLNCSQSAKKSGPPKYVWYRGKHSSLQEFEPIGRDRNKSSTPRCAVGSPSCYTEKTIDVSGGGIFACTLRTKGHTGPLFGDDSRCSNFDFFLVAIRNHTEEENVFGNASERPEPALAIAEQDTLHLTCKLQIKKSSKQVALYWFKDTAPSTCLFSAANEGNHGNFSDDVNCCVDAAIKQRRANHSVSFHEQWLHHNLSITNASSSDSGMYLCIVTIFDSKHLWKVARNVSVEVENSTPRDFDDRANERGNNSTASPPADVTHSPTNELQISLGVTGGVLLAGGILGLLYWKRKAKGNPVEERPRNQMEMEENDCAPYAVSSRKDMDPDETTYSVVTYPPEPRRGTSTLSDGKAASQSGEKVHTVYTLLSK